MTTKVCVECGTEFEGYYTSKTCSDECRKTRIRRKNNRYMEKYSKEQRNEWARQSRDAKPWKYHLRNIRNRCKRRGIQCTLTERWMREKYNAGCAVTGIAFQRGTSVLSPYSPSVDRINQAKGYTPRNCRMVLQGVNALRSNGTDEDMYNIAKAITEKATQ